MTYAEKLRDPRWQRKRLEVMQRDNFACQQCGAVNSTLNVHHWKYSKEPWDANLADLETLCECCHGAIEKQKKSITELMRSSNYRLGISRMIDFFERIESDDSGWVSLYGNPGTQPLVLLVKKDHRDESIESASIRVADRIYKHMEPVKAVNKRKKTVKSK